MSPGTAGGPTPISASAATFANPLEIIVQGSQQRIQDEPAGWSGFLYSDLHGLAGPALNEFIDSRRPDRPEGPHGPLADHGVFVRKRASRAGTTSSASSRNLPRAEMTAARV